MRFKESTLRQYAAPLSESENQKCLHAIEMVRDALKNIGFSDDLRPISPLYSDTYAYSVEMRNTNKNRKIKIFVQGSYANNTNVRTQSDVDLAVVQEEIFKVEYRDSTSYPQSDLDYGFSSVPDASKSFKDEVQNCLELKFGRDVERKNKSIKVHGNSYRKDADTVPCQRYRDYRNDYSKNASNYVGGIAIYPDSGGIIINYPEQHIKNGRQKNINTNHYFKKMVRIIKKMRYIMSDAGMVCADKVSSFGLESLLWNVPDSLFTNSSFYGFTFKRILNYLRLNTSNLSIYKEINGIKPLCPSTNEVDAYSSFINELYNWFDYELD